MFTGQKIKRWGVIQLPFLIVFALIAVSLPLTSVLVNKKGEESVSYIVTVEKNEKDQRILGVHTAPTSTPTKSTVVPTKSIVTPTKSASSTSNSNSCVGEGGTVVSGLYCCSGLTKQNCAGTGSFVYCSCKKPATNPTPTSTVKSCTTRTWVGSVCTTRTYTRASNLACDVSNCMVGDPTPKQNACVGEGGMVANGLHCCSGLTNQNCVATGTFSYCYCKKPATNPTPTSAVETCTTWTLVGDTCMSKTYTRASNLACDPSNCVPTPTLKPTKVPEGYVAECHRNGGNCAYSCEAGTTKSSDECLYGLICCKETTTNTGGVKPVKEVIQPTKVPEGYVAECHRNGGNCAYSCEAGTTKSSDECLYGLICCKAQAPTPTAKPVRLASVGAAAAVKTWFDASLFRCWQSSGKPEGCGCSSASNCSSQNCVAGKCQVVSTTTTTDEVFGNVTTEPTKTVSWLDTSWFRCWPASGRPDNCACDKDSRCSSQSCVAGKCQTVPTATVAPKPTTSCVYGVDYNGDGIVNSMDMMKCLQDK